MSDGMDSYLSRCLKNWAAQFHLPEGGRQRLLAMAASPPENNLQVSVRLHLRKLFSSYLSYRHDHDQRAFGPFTQSRTWSFHRASTMCMVS